MNGKLIFVMTFLVSVGGGLFAGEFLRDRFGKVPAAGFSEDGSAARGDNAANGEEGEMGTPQPFTSGASKEQMSYYRFPSQFFVPVMHGDRLDSVIVLTLSVEMTEEHEEQVYKQEFRLRDAILRTLLIHANTGGFDGNFTLDVRMKRLRQSLIETADKVSDGLVSDVLIEDIVRRDTA